jgi:predicted nucleotidyltransferase
VSEKIIEVEHVIRALNEAGVDFVLIGGLALASHGSDYMTKDFDAAIRHDKETATRLVAALKPYHPRPRGIDPSLLFVWDEVFVQGMSTLTLDTDLGDVDFLTEADGSPPYEVLRSRAVKREMFGLPVNVCSIDDLIAMKKAAGRVKDQLHLLELEAIKRILAEQTE